MLKPGDSLPAFGIFAAVPTYLIQTDLLGLAGLTTLLSNLDCGSVLVITSPSDRFTYRQNIILSYSDDLTPENISFAMTK